MRHNSILASGKHKNMNLFKYFVKSISFPLLSRRFGLKDLSGQLRQLELSQYWPMEKMLEYQFKQIIKLLNHAYNTTTYYKVLLDEHSIKPNKIKSLEDFKKIPFLTKDRIRKNEASLISTAFFANQLHFSETGGTTGVKMKFWRNNSCLAPKEASRYRFEKWTGWNIGDRMGLVWTAQRDYVGHWTTKAKIKNELFERQVVFPAAIIEKEVIEKYMIELQQKKPTMIRAFTSPLYEVAKVILEKGRGVSFVKGIVSTGEPLHGHQRKIIEKAFNCKVFDSYRSREAGPLAQECEEHNGLHINAESLYVEVIPPSKKDVFDQEVGEIVITDLLNFGMPLIRYKMGDIGIITKRKCPCGRGLPLLKQISGRSADMLSTPDGKQITAGSLVLYLVDEAPGTLGQVQIIQDKIDHLLIRMTPDPLPSDEIKNYQEQTVKRLFGDSMKVTFEIVDEIPRGKSGKYQFTKCMLE